MSALITVTYFLISMIFGLATFVLWVRFGLQFFLISSLHPISQIFYRLTDPILNPLARLFKIHQTRRQRYDWLCFGVLVSVEWIKYLILGAIFFGSANYWLMTVIYTLADLIIQPCDLLFYAIVIRVIMSWVNPLWRNPLAEVLYSITEPLLARARRFVPYIAGLDFSPFIVLIVLKIITIFVGASLPFHQL